MGASFEQQYQKASEHGILLSRDRASSLVAEALACLPLNGEYWECGVYKGGSAYLVAEAIAPSKPTVFRLFDTFIGLPTPCEFDTHETGEFAASLVEAAEFLPFDFIKYHMGRIPDSFIGLEDSKIAFCHLDLDLYWSTRHAIEFVWPRLMKGGSIVIDDYEWEGDIGCPGVKKAVWDSGIRILKSAPFQAVARK